MCDMYLILHLILQFIPHRNTTLSMDVQFCVRNKSAVTELLQ